MQSVSPQFIADALGVMRPIAYSVLMSFDKSFDTGIDFFTIGTSTIGGTDVLKGDNNVIQEWDKYTYADYTARVLSIEVYRETDPPITPITTATCDIVLDNHDDLFTPGNTASPLAGFLKSRRPVRVGMGFGAELIPKFVGMTDGKPEIDEASKTVTFHCVDFLRSILDMPLDEEVILINNRTDQIWSALLQSVAGLLTSQFDLDTGTVVVPFAYFPKGSRLGDALSAAAQAELGSGYMGENGRIKFENRQNWNTKTPVWVLDKESVLEKSGVGADSVINVVEVFSKARAVQDVQPVYSTAYPIELLPGDNDIFVDFKDDDGALPVTAITNPVYVDSAATSFYSTNELRDGTGDNLNGSVSLSSVSLFSTSAKLTFHNADTQSIFLTQLEVHGTPARVFDDIYRREVDAASVGDKDGFEEHPITITNDLIQDGTAASTLGQMIILDRADDDDTQKMLIKSVPQLQVGDIVTYQAENQDEDYFITRLGDIINNNGYRQQTQVTKRTINTYFRIGISTIGGSDPLGP